MIASDIVQLQNNFTNMVAKTEQAKRRQTELSHRLLKVLKEFLFIYSVRQSSGNSYNFVFFVLFRAYVTSLSHQLNCFFFVLVISFNGHQLPI